MAGAEPLESFDGGAFELAWASANEISPALEGSVLFALLDRSSRGSFTPVSNETQSNPHEPRGVAPGHATLDGSFHRAPHVTHVDVRQAHFDAVAHGVAA